MAYNAASGSLDELQALQHLGEIGQEHLNNPSLDADALVDMTRTTVDGLVSETA